MEFAWVECHLNVVLLFYREFSFKMYVEIDRYQNDIL